MLELYIFTFKKNISWISGDPLPMSWTGWKPGMISVFNYLSILQWQIALYSMVGWLMMVGVNINFPPYIYRHSCLCRPCYKSLMIYTGMAISASLVNIWSPPSQFVPNSRLDSSQSTGSLPFCQIKLPTIFHRIFPTTFPPKLAKKFL